MSQLAIDTGVVETRIDGGIVWNRPSTFITIDGTDILSLQRPERRPDGSVYPNGP